MSEEEGKIMAFLDELAVSALGASEDQLRADHADAGIDPNDEISRLKAMAMRHVDAYRRRRRDALPDAVPDDPGATRALLDELLSFPNAPKDAFTMAFREKKKSSEHDLRVLTENLLELMKKQDDS